MDPLLLGTASAFGLSAAAGLNTSLPLLLVGLAARFGLLSLSSPYDAIGSDVALIGLAVIAVVELAADKVPGFDSLAQIIQGPVTLAAGAILFASQQSIVQDVSPGLALLIGLLTAGGVHGLRLAVRPLVNLGTMGLGGPVISTMEDAGSVTLVALAILAPILGLILATAAVIFGVVLVSRRLGRHRLATQS